MERGYYEPKKEGTFKVQVDDGNTVKVNIPQSVLHWVWNNTLIHDAIGVKKAKGKTAEDIADESKEWFEQHSFMHEEFRKADLAIFTYVRNWQKIMKQRMEEIVLADKFKALALEQQHQQQNMRFIMKEEQEQVEHLNLLNQIKEQAANMKKEPEIVDIPDDDDHQMGP